MDKIKMTTPIVEMDGDEDQAFRMTWLVSGKSVPEYDSNP